MLLRSVLRNAQQCSSLAALCVLTSAWVWPVRRVVMVIVRWRWCIGSSWTLFGSLGFVTSRKQTLPLRKHASLRWHAATTDAAHKATWVRVRVCEDAPLIASSGRRPDPHVWDLWCTCGHYKHLQMHLHFYNIFVFYFNRKFVLLYFRINWWQAV